MEKETFTINQLQELDDNTIIYFAAPVIVASVLIEWIVGIRKKRDYYDKRDFMAAVAIGVGSVLLGSLLKVTIFYVTLLVYNAVPWAIPRTWWSFVLCFILVDLVRYWVHRISHEQRMLWATHVTHHSSQKMNFSVSFRTGWTQHIKFIFFLPLPFLGIDPMTFFVCHQLAVLYQFWVHTELIRRLPAPLEYFLVTPSHHRVHHGSNSKYIDKNYGSTFIIWDRLFNTFQVEEERPVYGLTKPVTSYNPVYLVFHEWVDLWKDLLHARSWKEVWDLLFKPPGAVVTAHQREQEAESAKRSGPAEAEEDSLPGTVKAELIASEGMLGKEV
jgi:sterol desaturase/sphingolipid hydroxylase (fatty acid hydroxylase superfamily)